MSASWIYGLLLGLMVASTTGIETASSTARSAAAASDETWTIPGAGRTPGLNNTQFVSDLALTNLGASTANVTISFVGPGGLAPKPITLVAGATTVYRNILDSLWSANGLVGALSVQSDQPLVLRARTYNTAATGTFGVALPVFADDDLISEGGSADSLWVEQSASGASGFRTNIGVVFPDAAGGEAVVTFYDASGVVVGTLDYSSGSAGFQQQSIASIAPVGLPVGRAQISVTRGHAASYAVGVDNVTGDTSLYPFEPLPAGVQDVVVSGVARLTGRNDTFFRTDARFYNPTPDDVTVTARFHAVGASNPTPQPATLTVPAGRILEVIDVLGSILNAPVGSGGAVRFTADQPIAILSRTSNVDPQGARPGTFGAQQHPVSLASYLSSADAGAVVTGIRQDASFRTNVGFAAGPDGAAYNLSLRNAAGNVVAVTTGSLGGFGWAQPSIADLFPGTTIPADATLLVQVTSGAVDVYDASIDNASGDLVVTPISAVPAVIPSSAQIGPSGGSIRSADGRLTLKVPAGALASATTLSIAPIANTAPNAIGSGYALSPAGVNFARPAQLVLSYVNEDLAGTGAGALGIAFQEGNDWFGILGGSVDPLTRTLRVRLSSTSPRSTAAAGGQAPQRSSQDDDWAFGPYAAVVINPEESSVVEGDAQNLEADFVGPSSTHSALDGAVLLRGVSSSSRVRLNWRVNGYINGTYPGQSGEFGTIAPGSIEVFATYTAPRCVPGNPIVEISATASLRDENGVTGPWLDARGARFRIIPKRWVIDLFYSLNSPCDLGFVFSVDFCRSHVFSTFVLQNKAVDSFRPEPDHSDQRTGPSAWCVPSPCGQPSLVTSREVNITDLAGTLIETNTLNPSFLLTVSSDLPGQNDAKVEFSCQGVAASLPIVQNATGREVRQIRIPYRSLANSVNFSMNPFVREDVVVALRPISCDLVAAPQRLSCN